MLDFATKKNRFPLTRGVVGVLAAVLTALIAGNPAAMAQSQLSQLTPEEQRMLSQLPPAQRQLLLERLAARSRGSATTLDDGEPLHDFRLPEDSEGENEEDEDPVFEPGDTAIVSLSAPEDVRLDEDQRAYEEELESRNPYVLNAEGRLLLPDSRGIEIAGLTEELAKKRLEADPDVQPFEVEILLLPITDFSPAALEPYGYSIFRDVEQTAFSGSDTRSC